MLERFCITGEVFRPLLSDLREGQVRDLEHPVLLSALTHYFHHGRVVGRFYELREKRTGI